MNALTLAFVKRELRDLHKLSIKGISVANGTINEELITEINHFMAVVIKFYKRFKPEFDI